MAGGLLRLHTSLPAHGPGSSARERYIDMVGATGSIPVAPTIPDPEGWNGHRPNRWV